MFTDKKEKIIVFIFDFDDTLIHGNMQQVLFYEYDVDACLFWNEVENLSVTYDKNHCNIITNEMIYLSPFLTYVKKGIFKGLNNKLLFKLGSKLKFFEGVIELFKEINEINKSLKESDIVINIYIVLSGFRQMILGSSIAPYIAKVWACEFIDTYLMSFYQGLDNKFSENNF
ncbi:hypothetical protein BmHoA_00008 [Borrelia miyamotoi]|nr:hypothetical protein BmHoA_00008 [Borrelia miyamotoi]BCR19794.1 hypothetical protein BmHoB_00009 [Borrelia miyamotoi]